MERCQLKKGLFVLSECGKPASVQCADCGIHVCHQHSKQDGAKLVCVECYSKNQEGNKGKSRSLSERMRTSDWSFNSFWFHSWYFGSRGRFYNQTHHDPFDERDYAGFEEQSQTEFDDDSDTGGFFDS